MHIVLGIWMNAWEVRLYAMIPSHFLKPAPSQTKTRIYRETCT